MKEITSYIDDRSSVGDIRLVSFPESISHSH